MVINKELTKILFGNMKKFNCCIFLDFDGVINHNLFYEERYANFHKHENIPLYKVVKKYLRKLVKSKKISRLDYIKSETDLSKIILLNELCAETNAAIVISASMRAQYSVDDLQTIFNYLGATFIIIDKTGYCECRNRGCEIKKWLYDNCEKWFGVKYYDFYKYAIIDDDQDFLLEQQQNFFQTDNYSGLTPTTCYKIKRLFKQKTFTYED